MEKIVLKYLNKNFTFTLSTLTSRYVKSRHTNEIIRMADLLKEIKQAFNIEEEEALSILDKWNEVEYVKINNALVDSQYLMYGKNTDVQGVYNSYKDYLDTINKIIEKE